MAGLAIAGLTSAIRLITKAAFEKSHDGLRKGASELFFFYFLKISNSKIYGFQMLKNFISCLFCFFLSAVIFLATATFIELLCVILYAYVFPKLPIVKYYRSKAASEGSKTVLADLVAAGIQKQSESVTPKFSYNHIPIFFFNICGRTSWFNTSLIIYFDLEYYI